MTSAKNLYILGAVLVIIAGAIITMETVKNQPPSKQVKPFFAGLKSQDIAEIRITGKTDTLRLFRKDQVWMISKADQTSASSETPVAGIGQEEQPAAKQPATEYAADTAAVSSVTEKVSSMKKSILVSNNPEKQEIFEVDSVNGVLVEITDVKGKSYGTLRVGKGGPDYNSNYVRSIGSDDVWLVSGGVKGALYTDIKRWRDKSMVSFDTTSLKELIISSKDTATGKVSTIKCLRTKDSLNQDVWNMTEPEKALLKKTEMSSIAGQLSSLKTAEWENNTDMADSVTGFDKPLLTASAIFNNGDARTVIFGKKQQYGGKLYAKVDNRKELFLVYETSLRFLQKKAEELKEPPAPVAGPEPAAK
jgi:hypothetical protein